MAFFEVKKVISEQTVVRRKQSTNKEGHVDVVEYVEIIQIKPGAYGHEDIKKGDVLEINKPFDMKARGNTEYFKEVEDGKRSANKGKGSKKAGS